MFLNQYSFEEVGDKQRKPFRVLGRMNLAIEAGDIEYVSSLKYLSLWRIQFEDGQTMVDYLEKKLF